MHQWEYLRVERPDDAQLADFGRQGWELVTVLVSPAPPPGATGSIFVPPVYIFKRPIG